MVENRIIYQVALTGFYSAFRSNTETYSYVALPANVDDLNLNNNNFPVGLVNVYKSQGKRAGIFKKAGQLWVAGTQAEFDALVASAKAIAEKEPEPIPEPRPSARSPAPVFYEGGK
jgi:hypothetical protein